MADGCCCCKVILYIINVGFFLSGSAVVSLGIIALTQEEMLYKLVEILTGSLADIFENLRIITELDLAALVKENAILLVVVGGVLFGLGFLGCCGACKNNRCMLTVYATIVMVVLAAKVGVGVYAYVASDKLELQVKQALTTALDHSYVYGIRFDPATNDVTPSKAGLELAWDYMQLELECCAVNNHTDYIAATSKWNRTYSFPTGSVQAVVPPSCCKLTNKLQLDKIQNVAFVDVVGCVMLAKDLNSDKGCYDRLRQLFVANQTMIIVIFVIVVGVEVIAVIAACILRGQANKDN